MLNNVNRRLNSTKQMFYRGEQMNFRKQRRSKDNPSQNENSDTNQNEDRD